MGREQVAGRSRGYCELLEKGQIVFFPTLPFHFPAKDQEFLLEQEWTELRLHKNVSYRPAEDVLRGVSGDPRTIERVHSIMRNYSAQVIEFLTKFLSPYAGEVDPGFFEFPSDRGRRPRPPAPQAQRPAARGCVSQPAHARRANPARIHKPESQAATSLEHHSRISNHSRAQYANDAGLQQISEDDSVISRTVQTWGEKLGFRGMGRTPYDMFMLRFHDYLKENEEFQAELPEIPDGISATSDLDRLYGWCGACSHVRPICDRADVTDSAASFGGAAGGALPDPREFGREAAGYLRTQDEIRPRRNSPPVRLATRLAKFRNYLPAGNSAGSSP